MSIRRWIFLFLHLGLFWVLAPSAWAQSRPHDKPNTKTNTKPQARTEKAPARPTSADVTAKLQAQAAAEAAAAGVRPQAAEISSKVEAPAVPVPALSLPQPPELLIAQQIHVGHLPCELGAIVRIEADATQPGYFHVHGKGFRYRMFPVQTSTGALRLEDKKAGAVWLQLANKSMLMDQKKGRRLADECAHPDQLAFAESMKTNPPPSLIDTRGMGR